MGIFWVAVTIFATSDLVVEGTQTDGQYTPGCVYSDSYPLVFDAGKQPRGEFKSPGYDKGVYHENAYCNYVIKAPPGQIIKLTFKGMNMETGARCTNDNILISDGESEGGTNLGVYCGDEPPGYPIVSESNAMLIQFRTNEIINRRGFHAVYEAIRPDDVCPRGYLKCKNNNCYNPRLKCDGEDDCLDGSDEEKCDRPLPSIACGSGAILPIESNQSPDRIVGGIAARPGSWPWQADLQTKNFYPESHICGGTLINAQWVMTAVHCLIGNSQASDWKVIVGNHDRFKKDPDEQMRYVETLVIYPGYTGDEIMNKPIDFHHDIALMKLNAPVKFSDRVRPACLPPQKYEMPLKTKCFTTGWGRTKGSGFHNELKQAEVYTQLKHKCLNMDNNETMICVKSEGPMLQDACHGDSGGPLNCKIGNKWHVMGITSFGGNDNLLGSALCAISKLGTVFNKVSAKIDWIQNMIKRYG